MKGKWEAIKLRKWEFFRRSQIGDWKDVSCWVPDNAGSSRADFLSQTGRHEDWHPLTARHNTHLEGRGC